MFKKFPNFKKKTVDQLILEKEVLANSNLDEKEKERIIASLDKKIGKRIKKDGGINIE